MIPVWSIAWGATGLVTPALREQGSRHETSDRSQSPGNCEAACNNRALAAVVRRGNGAGQTPHPRSQALGLGKDREWAPEPKAIAIVWNPGLQEARLRSMGYCFAAPNAPARQELQMPKPLPLPRIEAQRPVMLASSDVLSVAGKNACSTAL